MQRKTGYMVWLFGQKYWHYSLRQAALRSFHALNWCNGEHNQIIEIESGRQLSMCSGLMGEKRYLKPTREEE
jgi:hypothetical protein